MRLFILSNKFKNAYCSIREVEPLSFRTRDKTKDEQANKNSIQQMIVYDLFKYYYSIVMYAKRCVKKVLINLDPVRLQAKMVFLHIVNIYKIILKAEC